MTIYYMIKDIKKYIERFFLETKEEHPADENNILKSCLVYQWLYHKHFKKYISVDEILEINNYDIGLIGPNRGLLQYFSVIFRYFILIAFCMMLLVDFILITILIEVTYILFQNTKQAIFYVNHQLLVKYQDYFIAFITKS